MPGIGDVSDAQLVRSVARSSEVALAEAYRRHGRAVYAMARRVLGNAGEAEDVTQEVFLRLWKQPDKFDATRGTLHSFLVTQAHARAVDVIRSLNARRRRAARDGHRATATDYGTAHEVWDLALIERVSGALGAIPDNERRAIELAYFEGRTYLEVAQLLDEPEGTVKSRIKNGMRRMRAVLVEGGMRGADA